MATLLRITRVLLLQRSCTTGPPLDAPLLYRTDELGVSAKPEGSSHETYLPGRNRRTCKESCQMLHVSFCLQEAASGTHFSQTNVRNCPDMSRLRPIAAALTDLDQKRPSTCRQPRPGLLPICRTAYHVSRSGERNIRLSRFKDVSHVDLHPLQCLALRLVN